MEGQWGSSFRMWSDRGPRMVSARQLCALSTVAVLTGWVVPAQAHAPVPPPVVCPTPGETVQAGHRIRCVAGARNPDDIGIEVSGTTLITGEHGAGIEGRHEGSGDVRIHVEGTRITTSGHLTGEAHAEGIDAEARTGSVWVTLRDVDIETFGAWDHGPDDHDHDHDAETGANGVHASRLHGAGEVSVDIEGGRIVTYGVDSAGVVVSGPGEVRLRSRGTTVVTHGRNAHGLHGEIRDGTGGNIGMEVRGTTVMTYGDSAYAVWGDAHGDGTRGDVRLDVGGSTVVTEGSTGHGILGSVRDGAEGDVALEVRDTTVNTWGDSAYAVWGDARGDGTRGYVRLDVGGSAVTTGAENGHGILGSVRDGAESDVAVRVRDTTITTRGDSAEAVWGGATGTGARGDVRLDVGGSTVVTEGSTGHGILGSVRNGAEGDVALEVQEATVTTSGETAYAVWGDAEGNGTRGDVRLDVGGSTVTTGGRNGHGILGSVRDSAEGDVTIRVQDASVTTRGGSAEAVWGAATGTGTHGEVRLELGGSAVVTEGNTGHGILGSVRDGAEGDVTVRVREATVTTSGETAYAVWGDADGDGTRGDVRLDVGRSAVTTEGETGHGILGTVRDGAQGNVVLTLRDVTVTTRGDSADAVLGTVVGDGARGDVRLELAGSVLETGEVNSHGAVGSVRDGAEGDIAIDLRDTTVTTRGESAEAVWGNATGSGTRGDVRLDVGGSTVTTEGETGHGILGSVRDGARGNVAITGRATSVTTRGDTAYAVWGDAHGHGTRGDVRLDLAGSDVTTGGTGSHGIVGTVRGGAQGDVALRLQDTTVATRGVNSDGIRALGQDGGDVAIDLRGTGIETLSTAADELGDTWSVGVKADIGQNFRSGAGIVGDLDLRMSGGSIVTHGVLSRGIQAGHVSSDGLNHGDIRITTSGTRIETRGADADGILVYHTGTGRIDIRVDGGRIEALETGSSGIRVGQVTTPETRLGRTAAAGVVERAAPLGPDGYRRQTVSVNAPVNGGAGLGAGVFLAGGGRVIVGPDGRLGAGSGVAIFSAGDSEIGGQPVPSRLHVDLRPDGLRPSDLLDGTIRNDGGETVLAVNGVSLFDSTAGGRLSSRAPNGARDVALADGFAGLDFSDAGSFVTVWAPRAAVYEALPGILHSLDGRAHFDETQTRVNPGQPFRLRVSGGTGSRGGRGGTVGAGYEYDRHDIELGLDAALSEDGSVTGTLGVRRVSGSADVSAATGGGSIEARGYGVSLGLTWRSEAGWYGTGRVSATRYSVGFGSDRLGGLRDDVDALVHAAELEAGRRFGLGDGVDLTPKAWLRRSGLSVDGFADAAGARVSPRDASRIRAGAGATARARLEGGEGGTLVLEGLLGIEGSADSRKTRIDVSRETLTAREPGGRLLLGLGAAWQRNGLSVRTELGLAQGISTGDADWAGRVTVGLAF